VKVTFQAADVPSLSYRTYALVPTESAPVQESNMQSDAVSSVSVNGNTMENDKLSTTVEANGSLTVQVKASGHIYSGLNVFENTGDIGNEYVYRQPEGEQTLTTEHLQAEVTVVEHSPYCAVLQSVLRWEIPVSADETFDLEKRQMVPFTERTAQRKEQMVTLVLTTEYTLEAGSELVKVRTSFNNQAKDHRLRALFPTGIETDHHYADSIFEAAKRSINKDSCM